MNTKDEIIEMLQREIAALKEENKKLSAIIDKIPASIVITNSAGNIEFVNPYFSKLTGYSSDEVLGKNPRIMKSGYHLEDIYKELWNSILSGKVWEGELCNKKKNGELYWEQANIAPIRNEPGVITNYVGIKFDITAKKKALDDLDTAKKFTDILIDNANVMIVGINNDGNVIIFNKAAERISGYESQEIIGTNWLGKLFPQKFFGGNWHNIKEVIMNSDIPSSFEDILLAKSGEEKIISWQNTTLIDNGSRIIHISFGIDITYKKEAEKKLQDSETKFKKLIHNTGDVFAIVGKDLKIKFISNSVERITGFTVEESLGENIFDIVHPEDISAIRDLIKKGIDVENFVEIIEYRRKCKDGRYIYAESVIQNLFHDDLIRGVLINSRDITERKQNEMKLEELNATKDKLFSIIAHDLRGPIGNSALFLEMLADEQINFDLEEKNILLNENIKSLKNTRKLLENLLDWARSQKNDIRIERKSINIKMLVREGCDVLKMQAAIKKINLSCHAEEDLNIIADERMIITVMRNLVSNAIKYSYENGNVSVTAWRENDKVNISVNDDGTGMDREKIQKLFKITNDVSTQGTKGETGTGFGLILCQEFIDKNNGKIWVNSEPGKGSSFIMQFPADKTNEFQGKPGNEEFVQACPKIAGLFNILVVEDDEGTRRLVKKILKTRGWKMKFANNGREAIEVYKNESFDVLLMDIHMPVMDGICATNEIRKLEMKTGRKTPIIAFTTCNSREEIENYLKNGFDDFASKPVNINELHEKIEK